MSEDVTEPAGLTAAPRTLIPDSENWMELEHAILDRLRETGIAGCPLCAAGLPARRTKKRATIETHANAHATWAGKVEEPFHAWLQIAVLENVTLVPDEMGTRWAPLDDLHEDPTTELPSDFLTADWKLVLEAGFFVERRIYRDPVLNYSRECLFVDTNLWHLLLTIAAATQPAGASSIRAQQRWGHAFRKQAREFLASTKAEREAAQ